MLLMRWYIGLELLVSMLVSVRDGVYVARTTQLTD